MEANRIADEIAECFRIDTALTEEYHQIGDGMFDGFGLSEHIGFTNWNEEDNKYPIRRYIYPANHPRMILCRKTDEDYVIGSPWVDALLTRIDNPGKSGTMHLDRMSRKLSLKLPVQAVFRLPIRLNVTAHG